MAKLIAVNVLKQKKTVLWDPALGFCDCVLIEDIDNTPGVGAVPVIRCRDCRYFTPYDNVCDHPNMWTTEEAHLEVSENAFCSYAEFYEREW